MKRKAKTAWVYFIAVVILAAGFILSSNAIRESQSSKAALSYYGSRGREVIEIQKRLKAWGYYKGAVDGIYGYQTYQAVRYFQSKNGLKVDGIAGKATLYALGLPTGTTQYNRNLDLMARVIYGEARGEPYEGMVAVGAVVLNRVADSRFPNTIPGVIYQPGAFDVVSDGQINLTPNDTAYRAARDALNGWDPTYGCIYYFNPATATSKWIWSRPIVVKIGKHNFCK
ncbi:MAG: spore cortex-lytic enzyme [Clostridiaceae bacterium]|jgi:N-acetylmuramoyl-L-alanine amidase|nr:spore cortex-lytic enzyme [Clostridiaceae bacterium]